MEPDAQPELEPVTLLVKSPNQRHRDLELSCDRSWSVGHLKAHLSRVYPERPRPEDQRLIYSGKLLSDHLSLRELLPKQEKRHVLHLVCNVKTPSKTPETSTKVAEPPEQPSGLHQGQYSGAASSDGVRQREVQRNLPPSGWEIVPTPDAAQQTFQGLGPGFSGYTTYGWLQLSWFQQIYARQYYMQYLAATAASGAFVPAPSAQEIPVVPAPAPAPAPIPNQFPAENQPANQNAAPPVVANPGANQNLRMNAQGGPIVEEDDEINRDWLDWTYSAATFSVFLSILYFYSSLSRFLMVLGATFVMYLHHVGWFPFRPRPFQNFQNDGPPYDAVNQDPNNNLQDEGSDPEAEEPSPFPPDRDGLGEEQTGPSFMSTAWLVFKTFFASLLPEGPPALAN
ncbi:homocysteine-responsive endoplasmic reticulum-resident ubiquitin-like domain member 1 protein isoform X1 [Echinops telfairi]|uniref:Homocysteine-responsive endoplasmic reticulum-resident ubiquitin-like domain member 1 protein isoform X1 n=1 Tax=Echinops telfairi TaxID=9371 RepID=A0ABM0IPE0_ECHTE|nr:homocysteine-responsive endoplasmic reticulum-resident ubiquitin-like domain member 1 protein isoform X1 [Echinops telfairi]